MTFRGASAEALRRLGGELDSALGGGADAASVGSSLFSVAQVLRTEPSLRRVATDVSVATAAKQGLVREIFEGKVDPAALGVVSAAVGQRWTATRDLADVLEHLGVVAVVRSADADSARLSDELFGFGRIVADNPSLRDALADPARPVGDKAQLLHRLLDGKALPATVTLAEQALAGSYRTVGVALRAFQQVAADVHDQKVATVRVARTAQRGRAEPARRRPVPTLRARRAPQRHRRPARHRRHPGRDRRRRHRRHGAQQARRRPTQAGRLTGRPPTNALPQTTVRNEQ